MYYSFRYKKNSIAPGLSGYRKSLGEYVVFRQGKSTCSVTDPRANFSASRFTLPKGSSIVPEIQLSNHVDIESLRERLRKLTDAELLRFGKDNRYMCGPYENMGKPPLEAFVIQLREARAEWRRRHPKDAR